MNFEFTIDSLMREKGVTVHRSEQKEMLEKFIAEYKRFKANLPACVQTKIDDRIVVIQLQVLVELPVEPYLQDLYTFVCGFEAAMDVENKALIHNIPAVSIFRARIEGAIADLHEFEYQ